jgi:hypothetical protein
MRRPPLAVGALGSGERVAGVSSAGAALWEAGGSPYDLEGLHQVVVIDAEPEPGALRADARDAMGRETEQLAERQGGELRAAEIVEREAREQMIEGGVPIGSGDQGCALPEGNLQ